MHNNAAHSDVDTAAKIIRWVHLYNIIASFLDKFLLQFLTENMRQPRVQNKNYTSRCIHDNQILMVSDGDP